jgi:hypothetical protein
MYFPSSLTWSRLVEVSTAAVGEGPLTARLILRVVDCAASIEASQAASYINHHFARSSAAAAAFFVHYSSATN